MYSLPCNIEHLFTKCINLVESRKQSFFYSKSLKVLFCESSQDNIFHFFETQQFI